MNNITAAIISKKTISLSCMLLLFVLNVRAQDAASLLDKAIKAAGNWHEVKTITYSTTGKNYNKWQNYSFDNPVPTKDEAFRSYDFTAPAYYSKTISRYGGGYLFQFVNVGKDSTRYVYDLLKSRTGHLLQQGGKQLFDAGLSFINETFPSYALQTIRQSGDTLLLLNDSTIRRSLKDGGHEEISIAQDGRLKKISRVQKGLITDKHYEQYERSANLFYPKKVSQYNNAELVRVDELVALAVNEPFDEKLLHIPAEYKTAPPPGAMKATEISKDVYVIENVTGGRNVLFVSLSDGVLVTEAPLSKAVSQAVIDLIHKTVPGKKIRYVHLSHFHNDHTSGINAFLAEGATVIATLPTIAAVKTIVAKDLLPTFRFISFSKKYLLKDALHEVEFYPLTNKHAEGMSFVYLPKEQLVYQGDLYSLPDDKTITPAIEINIDFYKFLQKNKLPVKRIIGHHGAADSSMEDLEKAVKMRVIK